MSKSYFPVIGLEVHIELSTKSKMFCPCPADHFTKPPNTQVCSVCLGFPGALPFANREAIDSTIKFGLAMGCKTANFSKFDRKHYFYPDLPKGYQISQYDLPLCRDGKFEILKDSSTSSSKFEVRVRRIHLEEDTGKLVHSEVNGKKVSLIDFNRSGVALVELVTEPDFESVEEALSFLKEIQKIVRYLGISTADMEKGSMRLEANISLREPKTQNSPPRQGFGGQAKLKTKLPDYKVELKNINSFKFLKSALGSEIMRQKKLLEAGDKVVQETRGYDEKSGTTISQRTKEEAHDYRYFPEPDLPPISLSDKEIGLIRDTLPELPAVKRSKLRKLGLPSNYIEVLVDQPGRAGYFEKALELGKKHGLEVKKIADAMVNLKLDQRYSEPSALILEMVKLSKKHYLTGSALVEAVEEVLESEVSAVENYQKGKVEALGFLIGQVQKRLKGKSDPKEIKKLLSQKLS